MLADDGVFFGSDSSWFVYLFPLADCSAFKVGFSCNPLQRIYSFSHRYFERFDLYQSVLLEVTDCADARAIEGTLKTELVEFRAEAPSWVPIASGGHTEWFQALQFPHAEGRLRSFTDTMDAARLASTSEYIRAELIKARPSSKCGRGIRHSSYRMRNHWYEVPENLSKRRARCAIGYTLIATSMCRCLRMMPQYASMLRPPRAKALVASAFAAERGGRTWTSECLPPP